MLTITPVSLNSNKQKTFSYTNEFSLSFGMNLTENTGPALKKAMPVIVRGGGFSDASKAISNLGSLITKDGLIIKINCMLDKVFNDVTFEVFAKNNNSSGFEYVNSSLCIFSKEKSNAGEKFRAFVEYLSTDRFKEAADAAISQNLSKPEKTIDIPKIKGGLSNIKGRIKHLFDKDTVVSVEIGGRKPYTQLDIFGELQDLFGDILTSIVNKLPIHLTKEQKVQVRKLRELIDSIYATRA